MRHITQQYISKLLKANPEMDPKRLPKAFPGHYAPVRVAWRIQIVPKLPVNPGETGNSYNKRLVSSARTLQYCGKPNRYRALEAFNFMKRRGWNLYRMWAAELDRAGLVAYRVWWMGNNPTDRFSGAYQAYHPYAQPGSCDIIGNLLKPLHIKKVGTGRESKQFAERQLFYSVQRRLSQEQVDGYYKWFQDQFGRRLRRPKTAAMTIVGGKVVEESSTEIPSE